MYSREISVGGINGMITSGLRGCVSWEAETRLKSKFGAPVNSPGFIDECSKSYLFHLIKPSQYDARSGRDVGMVGRFEHSIVHRMSNEEKVLVCSGVLQYPRNAYVRRIIPE